MNQKNKIKILLKSFFLLGLVAMSFQALAVWQAPTGAPGSTNVAPPINAGSAVQSKVGSMVLLNGLRVVGAARFDDYVGIGTASPTVRLEVVGQVKMDAFRLGNSATAGNVLTAGADGTGTWQPITATGMTNPMTAKGDMIYASVAGTPATASALTIGSTGKVLTATATGIPGWSTIAGTSFGNKSANTVFAGPTSGGNATPDFRGLVPADIPTLLVTKLSSTVADNSKVLTVVSGIPAWTIPTVSALSANGANCPAGSYPLGVNESGAVEDCTVAGGGGGSGANGWTDDGTVVRLTDATDKVGIGLTNPSRQLEITKSFGMPDTTASDIGVIYKGGTRFIHNFADVTNLFVGRDAGNFNANNTGTQNTGVGVFSLDANQSGSYNSAFGASSLGSNTTGGSNSGFGQQSLNENTTGAQNTGVGFFAGGHTTSGSDNTSVGAFSLSDNVGGSGNTSLGSDVRFFNSSLGANMTTDLFSNLTLIGYGAKATAPNSSTARTNSTAIGYGATVNASNKIVLGNASAATVGGYGIWVNYSDRRLKENIVYKNDLGLNFITKLNPVSYNYKADTNKTRRDGLIAQDVQKSLQELGLEFSGLVVDDDADKTLNLSYGDFVIPLINSVKEQQKQIEDLKTKNDLLAQKVEELLKNK